MSLKNLTFILLYILQLLLLIAINCNAVTRNKIIASTNSSNVHFGGPFTFKCDLTKYDRKRVYRVYFMNKITGVFASYDLPGTLLNFNFLHFQIYL